MTLAGPVLVTERSALLTTVVSMLELLLLELVSGVLLVIVAVLCRTLPLASEALAVTVIVDVALALAASVERVKVTTLPLTVTPPPDGAVAPRIVSPDGMVSVTMMLCASEGPLLVTVIV